MDIKKLVLKLEDLKPESQIKGILGKETVKIISSQMMGVMLQQCLGRLIASKASLYFLRIR